MGWHAWTPDEIDHYRKHHPIGTKARLALELMLNVGARVSDARGSGSQHETEGWLKFVAWKGRGRNKKRAKNRVPDQRRPFGRTSGDKPDRRHDIPVNDLGRAFTIRASATKCVTVRRSGVDRIAAAHGLRKAASVIMAENGSTAPELCATLRLEQA